jgi:uncharacterized membrane protein
MDLQVLAGCTLIGVATGLRAMTGVAIVSWAARLNWIDLADSRLHFLGSWAAVVLLTAAAIGEYIGDKLPRAGKRTAIGPLITRVMIGAACGAALCFTSDQHWPIGAAAGALGAILGSFGGYFARVNLVRKLGSADIYVALPEDLLAIGLSVLAISCA